MLAIAQNRIVSSLLGLRGLLVCVTFALLNQIVDLQVGTVSASGAALIAIWLGTFAAFSAVKTWKLLLLAVAIGFGLWIMPVFLILTPNSSAFIALLPYRIVHSLQTFLGLGVVFGTTTVVFWRWPWWTMVEIVLVITSILALLSPHQEFHYNRPTYINSLAWSFGVTEVSVFLGLGCFAALLSGVYLYLCASPARPVAPSIEAPNEVVSGTRRLLSSGAALIAAFGIFIAAILGARWYFISSAAGRVSGGVGEAAAEGETPLGFHSALGTSSQPAAMVRLEGDYNSNPFAPMLYFRESALSELSGNEYLIASRRFDTDVPMNSPGAPYTVNPSNTKDRIPVAQSVYLLSDQKLSFSIDYPESIAVLQNPDPSRFRAAYRAHSLALTAPISQAGLRGFKLGDSRWDAETRAHYLKPHQDTRYANLAYQISADAGAITDIEKAFAIADYLTEATTYTLTPNHDVAPGEDPVAAYLFGDLRGYCVHFAHAMVHMYRALGIPARIGTGYLTDLNQSRDGHILLRMSDRHAWSEIYIDTLGWVPFDIKPEKVESHGNSDVDMKLLEELMQKVGPSEEILPEKLSDDEKAFDSFRPRVSPRGAVLVGLLLLGIFAGLKVYLRLSWKLSNSESLRAERGYRALAALLQDYGEARRSGETREEFRRRIEGIHGTDLIPFVQIGTSLRYGGKKAGEFSMDDIQRIHTTLGTSVLRRFLSALNPSSLVRFLARGAW